MRGSKIALLIALFACLQACASLSPQGRAPASASKFDLWWGAAAVTLGSGILLASAQAKGEEQAYGTYIGAMVAVSGLVGLTRYAMFGPPMVDAPESESTAPEKPYTRDDALKAARQAESDGRWADAWGAYRRAKDLGPPSQFIEDKLVEMEGKLAAPKKP